MALQHVEIDGKQHPYLLSYRALKNIGKFQADPTAVSIETVEHALYWALYSGFYKSNPSGEFTYKLADMESVLDDNIELFAQVQRDILELTKKINPDEGNGQPQEGAK